MQINCVGDNPYAEVICRYFLQSFAKASDFSKKELLEVLTDILVGTKNVRYGPSPNPESLVAIRSIVRQAIEMGEPIPMLIPWGGVKASLISDIDIAEVSAMQQIINLYDSIQKLYEPGMHINIGIEDTGAKWLYRDSKIDVNIEEYSTDFVTLMTILTDDRKIYPYKESEHMLEEQYFKESSRLSNLMAKYIVLSDLHGKAALNSSEWKELNQEGWKGVIPKEQRDYYRNRYKSLYPGTDDYKATIMLADYLAGAKVRYDLKAKGNPQSPVKGYLKGSFAPQVPGSSTADTSLFYRTVPMNEGRTHIAPWRAKGYLKIDERSNEVSPKVTSWHEREVIDNLTSNEMILRNEDSSLSVIVHTDYLIN